MITQQWQREQVRTPWGVQERAEAGDSCVQPGMVDGGQEKNRRPLLTAKVSEMVEMRRSWRSVATVSAPFTMTMALFHPPQTLM